MSFRIHFHGDVPHSRRLQDQCRAWSDELTEEFPELRKLEVTLERSADGSFGCHLHAVGKDVSAVAKAHHEGLREAAHSAFAKAEKQLRRHHDKQIYARRRLAHRDAHQ